jgi:hypothetical protein
MVVLDNGFVGINTGSAAFNLDVNGTARTQGDITINGSVRATSFGYGNGQGNTKNFSTQGVSNGVKINFLDANFYTNTSGQVTQVFIGNSGFNPTSGTSTYIGLSIGSSINQTGTANGITRGLYINPTLTSAPDWRAIETTTGSVIFNGGNVGIGTSTPSTSLDVSGSGRFTNGLTVTGSIASTVLTGSDTRVVVADTQGNLQSSDQILIEAFLNATGSAAITLNNTASWDATGSYIGTPVTDTYQGQQYYNNSYYFVAVDDNTWIRLLRG